MQLRTRYRIPRPSPALIVAIFALSLTMGGVSYAAAKLPRNSVGTPQLKVGAVTGWKVRNNTLTGADIREGTLKAAAGQRTYIGTDFRPADSGSGFDADGMRLVPAGPDVFRLTLDLPQGSRLRAIEVFGNDGDSLMKWVVKLRKANAATGDYDLLTSGDTQGDGGLTSVIMNLSPRLPVDNTQFTYVVEIQFVDPSGTATDFSQLGIDGMIVKWAGAPS